MTHYADAKLSLSEWVQDKAALIGKDFLTALWHHVTSDHVIDLMLTLLFFLSTFASLMIILVEVLGIPLLWFTTLPDNGSARANQGGDGNIREISSSSSHRDSFRSSPDEGGDLPPGSTHRRYFVPFFRYQPNVEERPVAISRPIRPRGVLTRSSVATKLSDRFISSESSE